MLGYLPLQNGLHDGMGGKTKARAMAAASCLYLRARIQARWGRVRSALTGRTCCLLKLAEVKQARTVHGRCYGGTQTVPLSQIRGTEGRCNDFDCGFRPLQEHTGYRWIGIAAARGMGMSMPPVELVQVKDAYFVRDGHHRISVARALGQRDIEAEVMVWHVDGPLPWEEPVAVDRPMPIGRPVGQPA